MRNLYITIYVTGFWKIVPNHTSITHISRRHVFSFLPNTDVGDISVK